MRIHDLLEVDVSRFSRAAPQWVAESLRRTPFVVVRRGNVTDDDIPVGVRGAHRSERWATSCHPSLVRRTVTPEELLDVTIPDRMPALHALRLLKERWGRNWSRGTGAAAAVTSPAGSGDVPSGDWGPGGSVGFELATGEPVVTLESDLDAVIYAQEPIDLGEARALLEATRDLPAAVDVRVETPRVGFSLAEYVKGTKLLLRTSQGAVLGTDPWNL